MNLEESSERNLMRYLCRSTDEQSRNCAYAVLRQRFLTRFFPKVVGSRDWGVLWDLRDDIVSKLIDKLVANYPKFKGNSRQYQKYVRVTLFHLCADTLREDEMIRYAVQSLEATPNGSEDALNLLEQLSAQSNGTVRLSTNWEQEYGVLQCDDRSAESVPSLVAAREQALEALDTTCQFLLHQSDELNLPHKQIAAVSGLSNSNVRTKLSRCRDKLKREVILKFAEQAELDHQAILGAIAQLPTNQQKIVSLWWCSDKISVRALGQVADPPCSQSETKRILAEGLSNLYLMLYSQ